MQNSLHGTKILLVEDDFLIQMDLTMTFENAGAEVVTAGTVSDGLARAHENYDAAVLDISLPDGEVYPLADVLAAKETPLVFHSGNTEGANISARFPTAIALSKPVHERQLIAAVSRQQSRA